MPSKYEAMSSNPSNAKKKKKSIKKKKKNYLTERHVLGPPL
jgi:hypothetical protein